MIVIRSVDKYDFEQYVELAFASHINFYTLPKDRRLLERRFERALHSFIPEIRSPDREYYLFVAQELDTQKLIGVAAISATSGGNEPLYFFRKEELLVESNLDAVVKELPILNPVSYVRGPSELASLFVLPQARSLGIGRLLSLSRLLFVARFSSRFTGTIIAELRGHLQDSHSLFWDNVGRHFFNKSFAEVQDLMMYGRSFISQFLPKYPIYIDLLPKEVQEEIGKVDNETMAAFGILTRLGFEVSDEIDILDGGPKLKAAKEKISVISKSHTAQISELHDKIEAEPQHIVSNERLDFRATYAAIKPVDQKKVAISREVASVLEVGVGDTIRLFQFKEAL